MNQAMRIVIAILTLLTTLALTAGAVWAFVTGKPVLLGIVCTLLAGGFGFFVKHDYDYFFGKKS